MLWLSDDAWVQVWHAKYKLGGFAWSTVDLLATKKHFRQNLISTFADPSAAFKCCASFTDLLAVLFSVFELLYRVCSLPILADPSAAMTKSERFPFCLSSFSYCICCSPMLADLSAALIVIFPLIYNLCPAHMGTPRHRPV